MIQQQFQTLAGLVEREARPKLWGFSAAALHDAYWRSFGVQCVRLGDESRLERGADLYLLLAPRALACFEIRRLAAHILWRRAALTRVRVVEPERRMFRERVQLDGESRVERIERSYRPRTRGMCRSVLTRQPRLARAWMRGESRREAWRTLHQLVGSADMDSQRSTGRCFEIGEAADEMAFVNHVVEIWNQPDRVFEGIAEIRPGIWAPIGSTVDERARLIEPIWIGSGTTADSGRPIIGPRCLTDYAPKAADYGSRVSLRPIAEIEPGDPLVAETPVGSAGPAYVPIKRIIDVLVSAVGLLFISPLLVVIALLVVLDNGRPVFYGHVRQGRGGKQFRCWKLRTMRRGADKLTSALQSENTCDGPQFFIKDDPRVTRTGRVLRKYHLDELPQLWNVLRGHMSLVGPRPSPDSENQICAPWRELRLSVRPGITGLWQVKGTRQAGLDFQEWIRYDVEYVRRASVGMDIAILFGTLEKLLARLFRRR